MHFVGVDHMLCGLWPHLHYFPMSHKKVNFKTFPTILIPLLMTFANRMDSDQARQSLGPDLDPICLIISRSFWKRRLWKKTNTTKRHAKLPNRCPIWVCTVWLCPSKRILALFWLFCLFDLMLYIPSTTFQLWRDRPSWVDLSDLIIYVQPTVIQLCRDRFSLVVRINVSCSRTQGSDAGEARTRGPSVSSHTLYTEPLCSLLCWLCLSCWLWLSTSVFCL